jgi:long-chain acyl-CoA synthetase
VTTRRKLGLLARDAAVAARYGIDARIVRDVSLRAAVAGAKALLSGRRDLGVAAELHASIRPDQAAVADETESLTWAEVHAATRSLSGGLYRLGVRPGDRVAICLDNGLPFLLTAAAVGALGASPAPLPSSSAPAELERHLPACRLLVGKPAHVDTAASALGARWRAVVVGAPTPGSTPWRSLNHGQPDAPTLRRVPSSADMVLYTSGTTGRSKGTRIQTRGVRPGTALRYLALLGIKPTARLFTPCPLYHAGPIFLAGLASMSGAALQVRRRFDDGSIVRDLLDCQTTHLLLVPALIERLLRRPASELDALRAGPLSVLLSTGAPLRPAVKRAVGDVLGPVLHELYGATELGIVSIGLPGDLAIRPDSVGRVLAGVQARVVGPDGIALAPTEVGELHVASDALAHGYDGDPLPKPERWAATGDLARLDPQGFLEIVGRRREMILSGGVNLFPGEIEEAVEAHPAVRACAVVGVEHARWGEAAVAFVVPEQADAVPDADVLKEHCRHWLAPFKIPKAFVDIEVLPRNGPGKVLKRALVEQLLTSSRFQALRTEFRTPPIASDGPATDA